MVLLLQTAPTTLEHTACWFAYTTGSGWRTCHVIGAHNHRSLFGLERGLLRQYFRISCEYSSCHRRVRTV